MSDGRLMRRRCAGCTPRDGRSGAGATSARRRRCRRAPRVATRDAVAAASDGGLSSGGAVRAATLEADRGSCWETWRAEEGCETSSFIVQDLSGSRRSCITPRRARMTRASWRPTTLPLGTTRRSNARRAPFFMKRVLVVLGASTRERQPRPAEVQPVLRVAAGPDVCLAAHSSGAGKCKRLKTSL